MPWIFLSKSCEDIKEEVKRQPRKSSSFSYFAHCGIKGTNLFLIQFIMDIRKISVLITALLPPFAGFSAPVGNTSAPRLIEEGLFISRDSCVNVRAGYEGDFVTNGRLKQDDQGSGRVDSYKQFTNSGTATLNILDRIDVYAVFGTSETKASWRFTDASDVVQRIEIQTDNDFLWAVGARGILFEWGNTCLGLGGRYCSAHYTPEWLTSNGASENVSNGRMRWKEWQIDLDISYKIEIFTPYIGTKYSCARTFLEHFPIPIANNGSGNNHFKNITPVGLVLGCSLSNGKYFMLNLEARLVDEEAITVSGDFRF